MVKLSRQRFTNPKANAQKQPDSSGLNCRAKIIGEQSIVCGDEGIDDAQSVYLQTIVHIFGQKYGRSVTSSNRHNERIEKLQIEF